MLAVGASAVEPGRKSFTKIDLRRKVSLNFKIFAKINWCGRWEILLPTFLIIKAGDTPFCERKVWEEVEMEKTSSKFSRKKIIAAISALLLVLAAAFVFLLFRHRYYIIYGIKDSLRKAEKDIVVEYKGDDDCTKVVYVTANDDGKVIYTSSMWLVNSEYTLDPEEDLHLVDAGDGHYVTETAYENLQKLFSACYDATGEELYITSSYRSYDEQEAIYAVNEFAVKPGASEHQCGLAVDIRTKDYASRRFIMSKAGKWIATHAHEYGFIVRYPYWGEDKTGVTYEPWHIRYVGEPHAEIIYRSKMVLEDYSDVYEYGKFYSYKGYVISHQKGDDGELYFPSDVDYVVVSSDNADGYYIWGK